MVEGGGAWIGTNQVPREREKLRVHLIKPGDVGSGFWEARARWALGATGILGAPKYPVKNNELRSYSDFM
jgi:hypothetical protein